MINSYINTEDFDKLRDKFKDYVPKHIKSHECNDQIRIMTYKNVRQLHTGKQTLITEVINGIRTKKERQTINKGNLPVAYFSANNITGRKKNENVTRHSGLIICDIDIDDNPETDFIQLKKDLTNNKYVYACFNSPSGGIKIIVNTSIKSKEYHHAFFESVKNYLLTKYNLNKIDTSGCNIARACYLPFDNNCYFNPYSFRYWLDDSQIKEVITKINLNKQLNNSSKPLVDIGSISYDEHYDNILNLLKKRTETGLYANIFNDFRYFNIERGIMDVSVPILELIILRHSYPYELNWNTRLDEYYFKNNPQKQINIMTIGCPNGLEVCKIGFDKNYVIKEHFRAWTLGSFTMKLIFNNPFCHPDYLIKTLTRINDYFCEDPNPGNNPKPDEEEVKKIVLYNYRKFLDGTLDFSTVVRKKNKTNEIYRKFVFKSKQYSPIDASITHLEAVRAFHEGKRDMNTEKYKEAICVLQNGEKINQKRIADYMGVSIRTVRRYMTDDFEALIRKYNSSIKQTRTRTKNQE